MNFPKSSLIVYRSFIACAFLAGLIALSGVESRALAQQPVKKISKEGKSSKEPEPEKAALAGPVDEYERGNPRSSVTEFFKATRDGDYSFLRRK